MSPGRSASEAVQVVFVRGNHDWSVDYEATFAKTRACEDLLIGDVLVRHGHQYDTRCEPHTRSYQRQMVLHHLAERAFGFEFRTPLHDHLTWQNRVGHWLGHGYGRYRMAKADRLRRKGRDAKAAHCEGFVTYWSRSVWGDPHDAFRPIATALRGGPYRAIVCGHTHLPGVAGLDGRHYVNAGSWASRAAQAAAWDGVEFSVNDFGTGASIGDEHYGWMLDGDDPGDFFDWWAQHYRGRLRFGPPVPAAESVRRTDTARTAVRKDGP
ncbi:MAG: hypothetical protein ACT4OX_17120 [Actinomycetota bacterium]